MTNIDDKSGLVMLQNTKAEKHTYSLRTLADFRVRIIESRIDGMTLEINGKEVEVMFVGKFNGGLWSGLFVGTGAGRSFTKDEFIGPCRRKVPNSSFFKRLYRYRGLCSYSRCFEQCVEFHS